MTGATPAASSDRAVPGFARSTMLLSTRLAWPASPWSLLFLAFLSRDMTQAGVRGIGRPARVLKAREPARDARAGHLVGGPIATVRPLPLRLIWINAALHTFVIVDWDPSHPWMRAAPRAITACAAPSGWFGVSRG